MNSEDLANAEADARAEKRREARKRRNELYEKELSDWTVAELCEVLGERYAEPVIPPCRVCGKALSLEAFGSGPSVWACSGLEEVPGGEGETRYAVGRRPADDHYGESQFTDHRRGGDVVVLELIGRVVAGQNRSEPTPKPAVQP